MSDLYIAFDEAYDAPTPFERYARLISVAKQFKISYEMVADAFDDYIDSDMFYAIRGM
jgi:hypothetical protein